MVSLYHARDRPLVVTLDTMFHFPQSGKFHQCPADSSPQKGRSPFWGFCRDLRAISTYTGILFSLEMNERSMSMIISAVIITVSIIFSFLIAFIGSDT